MIQLLTSDCKKKTVTFDVRELEGKPAGIGRVISSLVKAMTKMDNTREYILLGYPNQDCSMLQGKFYPIKANNILWHIKCARIIKENPQWGVYISVRSPLVPIMVPDRSIYFVNDLISHKYPKYLTGKTRIIDSIFVKLALQRVNHIVAISQSTALDIERLCPGAKPRITVIPLAADLMFKKKQPDAKVIIRHKIEKPYILSVGTIEPRKNHLSLLKAYKLLPKVLRDKYDLVIVGKRGWRCGHIMHAIEEAVQLGSVKYLEFLSDGELVHIYNGATLFVYPSFYEGFGLPVVEAMSCGLPVITSNVSSLPEVGGEAAVLIDPNDIKSLSEAMSTLLSSNEMLQSLSKKSIQQSNLFSWDISAKKVLEVIDSVVSK